jgi:phosphopentomutase
MARAIILVLDSLGIGHAPDAEKFGDVSANTFGSIAKHYFKVNNKAIALPNLAKLGLIEACMQATPVNFEFSGGKPSKGAYGYAAELSTGKDTPSGHWEMAGVPVLFDWGYFEDKENAFPIDLIAKIDDVTGYQGLLGNCHASGTDIIEKHGEEHIKTGLPICYTSGDSVFQVAAHEEHFGLDNLYKYCEQVRTLLDLEKRNIGRVIARPFVGESATDFNRTGNRRDYSVLPPSDTVLVKLAQAGGHVVSIGKIADIFAHQGISEQVKATGIDALVDATISQIETAKDNSLIFTNLVNFDQDFGHRRDPIGYAEALQDFDQRIPEILEVMDDNDVLFLTADHGCDPTWPGSDHTREYVPILAYHHNIDSINLGEMSTFADLGQTLTEMFSLSKMEYGTSFYKKLQCG